MAQRIKFGLGAPTNLTVTSSGPWTPENMVKVVQHAEKVGFDIVAVADHIFLPDYWKAVIPGEWIDAQALISHLAAHTSKIRLIINALVVPYRQPFTTAKWCATVDQLSGGRFVLGVVPGYLKEEYDTFKLPLEERSEMTDEFIRIMQTIWTGNKAAFKGKYYQFEGIEIGPKCRQTPHLPIWMGGSSKRAIRRAVELGNGWAPISFQIAGDEYRKEHAAELKGKTLPTMGTGLEELRRDVAYAREYAAKIGKPFNLEIMPLLGVLQLSGSKINNMPGRGASVVKTSVEHQGNTQGIIEDMKKFIDAGATGFFLNLPSPSVESTIASIDQFANEVMTKFGY